ncbi:MAG: bifunctional pyr operon transcriptional regulator/uracil phosphoribosyltransferase PyrR [bacterium]|nr:bifunctional pyr operon transcriptional regulator/uracil phosphoribosyltransferase PyrR [bacterium]
MGKIMEQESLLLDKKDIDRTLNRIAHEIWERNRGLEDFAFIGIRRRGVSIAQRLADKLRAFEGVDIPVGALDITLYRDDLSEIASQPVLKKTEIPFAVHDRKIVLCDDVLYSGRTVRAALDSIIDLGRPMAIRLAVLIDRGHRELPIQPNYAGKIINVAKDELVEVHLAEDDGVDEVIITRGALNGTEA